MDVKLEALLAVARLQSAVGSRFVLAEAAKSTGDFAAAHPAYQEYIAESRLYLKDTLDFNTRFPESPFELPPIVRPLVNALMVDADITYALGDRAAAEALREEALLLSQTHLGKRGTAEFERSRASSLALEGRFNEAIMALMDARDVVLESGDTLGMARIAIDLADILDWLGDFRRAKDELDHAASAIDPFLGNRGVTEQDVFAGVLSSISSIMAGKGDSGEGVQKAELYRSSTEISFYRGLIAKALGQYDEAERLFNLVLPSYRSLGSGEAIEYQLAQISLNRGNYSQALDRLRSIAGVFERGAFRPKRGVLQKLQAECLHALGDSSAALPLIDASVEDLTQLHFDPDALWRAQRLRARIYSDAGDQARALESWREAIGTISELRRAPLGYRLDSTYLADKKEVYSQAIADAVRTGAGEDGCRFIEGIKSRTLSAVLSIPRSASESNAGLEGSFDVLTRQLDAIEYQAYRDGWTVERQASHQELLGKRTELLERIRIGDPRWRSLSHSRPLELDAALKVLSERSQAALTLHYEPPNVTAVLLFAGGVTIGQLTLRDDLPAKLADYSRNLQKPQPDPFKHDLSAEYSIQAADLIPAPLLERAFAAQSLVVIPHEILHLVPWASLMHAGKRLFERLPVGVSPNLATAVAEARFQKPRGAALLGVGRYPGLEALKDLPSTQGEIEDIGALYGNAGVAVHGPLLDADATEAAFWDLTKRVSGPGNLLHISCHGTIVPNEPMNSGLLLADGKVDAAEVARGLPFDEVVLSACSTGWRPTQVADIALTADEILGIPAGFLEAGVRAVLVSIPKAEGKTARALTTHYHRRRAADDPPLVAFQAAQKQMLASGAAPGAWVGFVLYGSV